MKRIDFCDGWQFSKVGSSERMVDLPHDAMLEEKRDPESPGGGAVGYFLPGTYVYEKTFHVPSEWSDKYVAIQFEGVYRKSKVYVNGREAGGCSYGYVPFTVPLDDLKSGEENVIRVEVDNKDMPNSRWYSGAGIYRPVWLWVGEKSHIDIQGVKISTESYDPARIRVETAHTGSGEVAVIITYKGQQVASGSGDSVELDIPNAKLWSAETPELYECCVTLTENGEVLDEVVESFGIRTVEWSPKGLLINGKETLLRGGCVHHDNGILGSRSYAKSEERRVRILKEAGFNAIRSSHNPASKAMLEACDRLGMYVMDETWDMWYSHKNKYDYASDFIDNYKYDISAMVNRDFNHPSVIMYSIGNEVSEPHQDRGVALAKEMIGLLHKLDPNRAVTAGVNLMIIKMASKGKGIYKEEGGLSMDEKKSSQGASGSLFFNMMTSVVGTSMNNAANGKAADAVTSPVLDALDIAGYNYGSGRYLKEGKAHPNRIVVGSETFPQDIAKNWAMVKKYPYLIGDFMWTAWDYLGEVGIGAWAYTSDGGSFNKPYPWLLADVGAIDILGHANGEAFHAAAVWGLLDKSAIAVQPVNHPGISPRKAVWRGTNAIPSWAWKGCDGNRAVVEIYSDSAFVELLLNGKSIGKKKAKGCKAAFKTKYTPGTLTAVSYDASGREISRAELQSATGKAKIRVLPEEPEIKAGDIVYVDVDIVGENGVVESNADATLTVNVEGGELLAFGSANPRTEESYLSGAFTTYYGRALAVVRCKTAGEVTVRVSGDGFESTSAKITVL